MMNHWKWMAVAVALVSSAEAAEIEWKTDIEAAKEQAADQGKDLFLYFTGSDWCGYCIELKKKVLSNDVFADGVKDNFVLVMLDFPRDTTGLSAATQAQNKVLGEQYAVSGYPTVVLADKAGAPYAITGYREGGPEEYVKHLNELRQTRDTRDRLFAAAKEADGEEKAKTLIEGLKAVQVPQQLLMRFYDDQIKQLKEADPKDTTGFIGEIELQQRLMALQEEIDGLAVKEDFAGVLKLLEEAVQNGGFEASTNQRLIVLKGVTYANMGQMTEALDEIDKALKLVPDSSANQQILQLREQIAAQAKESPEGGQE